MSTTHIIEHGSQLPEHYRYKLRALDDQIENCHQIKKQILEIKKRQLSGLSDIANFRAQEKRGSCDIAVWFFYLRA